MSQAFITPAAVWHAAGTPTAASPLPTGSLAPQSRWSDYRSATTAGVGADSAYATQPVSHSSFIHRQVPCNPHPRRPLPLNSGSGFGSSQFASSRGRPITATATNPSNASPPPGSDDSIAAGTPTQYTIDYELGPGEIGVRFINTPLGRDVIAAAKPGEGLLSVGDSVGVRIPRACVSGLCGSCTCDVLDSTAVDGRQTIRACQAGAQIPDGGVELIVDVARIGNLPRRKDPMARFENLDTEYVAGAAPAGRGGSSKGSTGLRNVPRTCTDCNGRGEVMCYNCDGTGFEFVDKNGEFDNEHALHTVSEGEGENGLEKENVLQLTDLKQYACQTCVGMKTLRCSTCQGTGEVTGRS